MAEATGGALVRSLQAAAEAQARVEAAAVASAEQARADREPPPPEDQRGPAEPAQPATDREVS